jgi:hypothetical protein
MIFDNYGGEGNMFRKTTDINRKMYHYSSSKYTKILSLRRQIELGIKPTSLSHEEDDYMSFLFEKAPLDLMYGKYPKDHAVWGKDTIYEHVITISDIDEHVEYFVVETKELVDLIFTSKDLSTEEYFVRKDFIVKRHSLHGHGVIGLSRARDIYSLQQRNAYTKLLSDPKFKTKYLYMYAPTVPHVMLRVPNGEIIVDSVRTINMRDYKIH